MTAADLFAQLGARGVRATSFGCSRGRSSSICGTCGVTAMRGSRPWSVFRARGGLS
jgi:hypothetical protein